MHYDKDMLYIKQMDGEESFYHYTTIDAFISIISKKEFWITKFDYLNDIDEFQVAISIIDEVLADEKVEKRIIDDVKTQIVNFLHKRDFFDEYYVLSFSCNGDSQLLWSNYSKQDGISIKIDFDSFKRSLNARLDWHGLVIYDRIEQYSSMKRALVDELLEVDDFGEIRTISDINNLSGKKYDMTVTHIAVICIVYSMFFKRECFSGEMEYRFVFSPVNDQEQCYFRNKSGIIIPFIKRNVNSLDFISGVTLGPTNNMDNSIRAINEFLNYYGCNIKAEKSRIPLRY